MLRYFLKRIALFAAVLWAVGTLVFSLIHLVPGDPVDLILGEQSLATDRQAFRESLGLNRPLLQQYFEFHHRLLWKADLGQSLFEQRPVSLMIRERYPATLQLALASLAWALCVSLPLGVLAAVRKGSACDYGATFAGVVGISVPPLLLGPLLVLVFAVGLDLLPISGRAEPAGFLLPALTLGSGLAAILTRMTRASLLETLREDYVRTARAKGVGEGKVIWKHAFRNALIPIVTITGLQFGVLLGGAVVTEKIFAWPGLGSLLVQSIERRDYPVLQGCVLAITASYVAVNLLTDLVYFSIDPRIRWKENG